MRDSGSYGWVYCPHCDVVIGVLSEDRGHEIYCIVCDKPFIPDEVG